jgi:hypothetical protein
LDVLCFFFFLFNLCHFFFVSFIFFFVIYHLFRSSFNSVEYLLDGQPKREMGSVVLATGGYGADFSDGGLLKKYRPDVLPLPTTNGDHTTGDGEFETSLF